MIGASGARAWSTSSTASNSSYSISISLTLQRHGTVDGSHGGDRLSHITIETMPALSKMDWIEKRRD